MPAKDDTTLGESGIIAPSVPIKRRERCETCRFAVKLAGTPTFACRFGPPTVNGIFLGFGKHPLSGQTAPQIIQHTAFPEVQPDEWCGQWVPKEEAALQ